MSDFITKLSELIDPEVMGDMVSARIPKKLRVAPFAKIDDTLQGVPGDTITVPAYTYIGDASDVAEGGEVAIEKMTTSTRKATIKKAMKGIGQTILKQYEDMGAIKNVDYDADFKIDESLSSGDEVYFIVAIQPVDSAEKLFFTVKTR